MTVLLIFIGVLLLLIFGSILLAMLVFSQNRPVTPARPSTESNNSSRWSFNLKYIALPLIILVLTIIMVVWFSSRLPVRVAYHFTPDNTPDAFTGRGTLVVWTLLPQGLLTFLAAGVAWGITRIASNLKTFEGLAISLDTLLFVMGNMVGLPQLIVVFAMLNIFSYNAYQVQVLPVWLFALIVMGIGAIILGIFFINMIRKVGGTFSQNPPNNSRGVNRD